MEIDPRLLDTRLLHALYGLAAVTLLLAVWQLPWRQLLAVPARQHLFGLVVLSLVVLWLVSFHPEHGISLHLLGISTATLLMGSALAMLAGLLAQLALVWLGQSAIEAVPVAWLLTAVVPALTTRVLWALLAYFPHRNLFIFLLGMGFLGAMVPVLAVALAGLAVLALGGQGALVENAIDHVIMLPLLMFPEGFVNGAATSVLTVYFPHLVRGFDESRYLSGPGN